MALLEDLDQVQAEALQAFQAAGDPKALEAARVEFLGTHGKLKALLGRMGEIPREQKPQVGKRANELNAELNAAFEQAKARITAVPGGSVRAALKQERLLKLKTYDEKLGRGAAWGARFPEPASGQDLQSIADVRKRFPPLGAQAPEAQAKYGTTVLAARVMLRRDQSKKLIFLTVQDQTGSIQVALWNNLLDEDTLGLLRDTLDLWDIVGIEGELRYTQRGEPTVWATRARLLSKCVAPPPDKPGCFQYPQVL